MPNLSNKKTPTQKIEKERHPRSFECIDKGYTEESVILEAQRCLNCLKPSCMEGCPIHNHIPAFIKKVTERDFDGAFSILEENTCFPEICGKICPHEKQCEGHCIRNRTGEPVAIGNIENFIAKKHREKNVDIKKEKSSNPKRIAVIGSGPASLAFALKTAQKGHKITIFEKNNELGGILKWGIPNYRLEENPLSNIIEILKKLDVEILCGKDVGDNVSFESIYHDFDFVFIGVGASVSKTMNLDISNDSKVRVVSSEEFLRKTNYLKDNKDRYHIANFGEKIVVVGGGNAAMDCARNAIRYADTVNILYRRTKNEMPACKSELEEALDEGVVFNELINPVAIKGNEIECEIMELGEPDESGRRKPVVSNKPHQFIPADTLVMALGFDCDINKVLGKHKIELDKWGSAIVDEKGQTSDPKILAGGDVVTGPSTVVSAMAAGIRASKNF